MARKLFCPRAVDIAQVDTVLVAGTWVAAETITVSLNGNDLVITVGTDVATTDIAILISRAINASTKTDNLFNDESRNIGGQQIPEFTDIAATVSGSTVTITGNTRGQPFSGTGFTDGLSVSETSALGTLTHTNDGTGASVRPTGKNWFTNANNWSGETVPIAGDTIVLQNTSIGLLYGLAQSALTTLKAEVDQSFEGTFGLPLFNNDATIPYKEWRDRFFIASWATTDGSIVIGGGSGAGSRLINIDMHTVAAKAVVIDTGTPTAGQRSAVNLQGGTGASVDVRRGSVSIGDDAGSAVNLTTLNVSTASAEETSADVYVGGDATITTILKNGGQLEINSQTAKTFTTLNTKGGTALVRGDCVVTNLTMSGTGVVVWESTGAITALEGRQRGVLDLSTDIRTLTIDAQIEIYSEDFIINDPHGRIPVGTAIDFNNVPIRVNQMVLGENRKLTIAATT